MDTKLETETLNPETEEYRSTLWNMECTAVFVQELLEAYKNDDQVIQSFLVKMDKEQLREVKLEIEKFQAHIAEVETSLALDRQALET